ncbi:hypothetical protein CXG81DRAFT_23282 [Caulochytrium protostelioides]|uniref:SH3 domain-containing protein n=1 Tax=Caulochytrium protostelioides TaxID=1555241 RepID=A0A4P9XF28_9FUNG|nr:hypothetical protein CXG81DRAFT_23282 [Caulochytrium protostelioides]|eukprot:RKP04176.1 hypothetical protein CXG81DRAFT_23282 [Caulochytrium protostelioides]
MAGDDFATFIKNLKADHAIQLQRIQSRADSELEIFDHVREFLKKRIELDSDHAKRLDALVKDRLGKKIKHASRQSSSKSLSLDQMAGANPRWAADEQVYPTVVAYHRVLVNTEAQAGLQQKSAAQLQTQAADVIKDFNTQRRALLKKHLAYAAQVQGTLHSAYDELVRLKSLYVKTAKDEVALRKRYDELAAGRPALGAKLRNLITMDKNDEKAARAQSKWKMAGKKVAHTRNDYLVHLAGVNALQTHYYTEILPQLCAKAAGGFVPVFERLFTLLSAVDAELARILQTNSADLRDATARAAGAIDPLRFGAEYDAAFRDPGVYAVELAGDDDATAQLVVDDVARITLGQAMALRQTERQQLARDLQEREAQLRAARPSAVPTWQALQDYVPPPETGAVPPAAGDDPAAGAGSGGRILAVADDVVETENTIDWLRSQLVRLDALLAVLAQAGVTPIYDAGGTDQAANAATHANLRASYLQPGDTADTRRASLVSNGSNGSAAAPPPPPPAFGTAVATFTYAKLRDDEINIEEGDELQLLEPFDASADWILARNLISQARGLAPVSYLRHVPAAAPPPPRAASPPVAPRRASTAASAPAPATTVTALYDYAATDPSELTLAPGDVIRVTDAPENHADAWWEGQLVASGHTGLFPVVFTRGWEAVYAHLGGARHASSPAASASASAASSAPSSAATTPVIRSRTSLYGESAAAHEAPRAGPSAALAGIMGAAPVTHMRASLRPVGDTASATTSAAGTGTGLRKPSIGSTPFASSAGGSTGLLPLRQRASQTSLSLAAAAAAGSPAPSAPVSQATSAASLHAAPETALALYDYAAQCEGELSLTKGERVTVTSRATGSEAWWEGRGRHGRGQFPAAYVQVQDPAAAAAATLFAHTGPAPSPPTVRVTGTGLPPGVKYEVEALYPYDASDPQDLSFAAGARIYVLEEIDGWYRGRLVSSGPSAAPTTGLLPANYTKRV